MSRGDDHADDYDLEQEDEYLEHEDEDLDQALDQALDIPDVDWKEDIEKIENDNLRQTEIEKAEKIVERKKQLDDQFDRGDIDLGRYDSLYTESIKPSIRGARMSAALATVGLNSDNLGDLAEDKEFLPVGDTRLSDLKDELKQKITVLGPDTAQEEADRLLEEEVIGKDAHSRISRQARIERRRSRQ